MSWLPTNAPQILPLAEEGALERLLVCMEEEELNVLVELDDLLLEMLLVLDDLFLRAFGEAASARGNERKNTATSISPVQR